MRPRNLGRANGELPEQLPGEPRVPGRVHERSTRKPSGCPASPRDGKARLPGLPRAVPLGPRECAPGAARVTGTCSPGELPRLLPGASRVPGTPSGRVLKEFKTLKRGKEPSLYYGPLG